MSAKEHKMLLDGCVTLITKLAHDYDRLAHDSNAVPDTLTYTVASLQEAPVVTRSARMAAMNAMKPPCRPLQKFAFDTRRFDQETVRNPRSNLQNWVRSDQFIDEDLQGKIDVFARLIKPLDELKESFGHQPEWHNSYARTLHETVYRILRVAEADLDIFRPQIAYLEQLMFARYRLSMEELARIKTSDFKDQILKKDESLLKRGAYLHMTDGAEIKRSSNDAALMKDGNGITQESIVNAIFGNNGFRRDGEKTVERTITITIKDSVVD